MSSMSAIYLDPKTSVPRTDTGKSIFEQMMDELRGKHKALVDELTEFRAQRFPEVSLDDTQTFDPIRDEIVAVAPVDVTTVDEIEVIVLSEKQVRRRLRNGKFKAWRKRQGAKVRTYLYEHWGVSYEPRHKD